MGDLTRAEHAVEAAAEAAVQDTVAWVRAHPQYQPVIEALGQKALQALMEGL
jgi:predicted protein tyrosine phosphatase